VSLSDIAKSFVDARQSASALHEFPGILPEDLATGYAIQEAAISLWRDAIAGWKIGRVPSDLVERLGAPRVTGPIFDQKIQRLEPGAVALVPVFEGGFAAVEGEFVARIGHDAPPGKTEWTLEEAEAMVSALHMGIETAGSPLAIINVLGPTAVASDFGNNNGLLLGPALEDWRGKAWSDLPCETWIEGTRVGQGTAASVGGGPTSALCFLLEHLAKRGRPLKEGDWVSTGAATGIHDIFAGEHAVVRFGSYGELRCKAVRATSRRD